MHLFPATGRRERRNRFPMRMLRDAGNRQRREYERREWNESSRSRTVRPSSERQPGTIHIGRSGSFAGGGTASGGFCRRVVGQLRRIINMSQAEPRACCLRRSRQLLPVVRRRSLPRSSATNGHVQVKYAGKTASETDRCSASSRKRIG